MAKRMRLTIGGITCEAELFEDKAPDIVAALWKELPFVDRTYHVANSGNAWRTSSNHDLVPRTHQVENLADRLGPGDIIYWFAGNLNRVIGFAYGQARWYAPGAVPVDVSHIGRIDKNLEEFVRVSSRVLYDGNLTVWFDKA